MNSRITNRSFITTVSATLFLLIVTSATCAAEPSGDAIIRGRAGNSEIVITTTARVAGAVHSLTWNGKEFIDSTDHGRQLQSASNLDRGTPFTPETFNPTEAGSRNDGIGPRSSSKVLYFLATDGALQSTSQMAFWLRPGETSDGQLTKNTAVLSNHLLTKRVRVGYKNLPHVVQYDVTFSLPIGEHHNYAQFEALTGYMPPEFEKFWRYNPQKDALEPLSDGPGEQRYPVVLATADGSHAMGVYSPDQPSEGFENAGYGRWRFKRENVVKWNVVFRVRSADAVRAGEYPYRNFIVVGDLATVRSSLRALHDERLKP
jgi:hypothetical protein